MNTLWFWKMRRFLFWNYWWITILFACLLGWVVHRMNPPERTTLLGGIIAGSLGLFYFVEKQKLSEIVLFKELLSEFNKRFHELNSGANRFLMR